MRVAIVGSGIAGLTAGWLLSRCGHHVTLLERLPQAGLAAHGSIVSIDGQSLSVDVPPRMFNRTLWPTLCQVYDAIGVRFEPVDPSKTFAPIGGKSVLQTGATHSATSRFSDVSLIRVLFNPTTRKIARDVRRLMNEVPAYLQSLELDVSPDATSLDFETYLNQNSYSEEFIYEFLFPALSSTVCTCCYESLKRYPAETILRSMQGLISNDGLVRAKNGNHDVAQRLLEPVAESYFDTCVESVVQSPTDVHVRLENGRTLAVDHLIVATQANSAASFLEQATAQEHAMLDSFCYEDIEVVIHSDEALMPKRRRDWSHFNLLYDHQSRAQSTIWMNRFYPEWNLKTPVFQTIMPVQQPKEELVLCRHRLQRPAVNFASIQGLELLDKLHQQAGRRVWFCGSYASPGVPLLESGVVSAIKVARWLNVKLPDNLLASVD